MINNRTLLFLIATLLLAAMPVRVTAQSFRPVAEVRTLARYQDELTQGKKGSVQVHRLLIRRISQEFRKAPPKMWSVWRNSVAAVKYLISGGDPTFAENDEFVAAVPAALQPLLLASLAYAKGHAGKAKQLFAKIDPREIDPSLAGHVALIKSLLAFPSDPEASMRSLDDARLLGAGTLVEEAAIRRQMSLVVHRKDHNRFQQLSMRYVRKFQKSVYAAAFREHLADGLTKGVIKADKQRNEWLNALFDKLDRSIRPDYCMTIAERALIRGRPALVRIAALRLQKDVGRSSRYGQRAKLFNAAMKIVNDDDDKAFKDLKHLTNFPAGSFENNLRQAAIAMAKGIAMPVDENLAGAEKLTVADQPGKSGAEMNDAFASTRAAALSAIREAKRLLAK